MNGSAPLQNSGYPTPPPSFTADDLTERNGHVGKLHGIKEEAAVGDAAENEQSSAFPSLGTLQDSTQSPGAPAGKHATGIGMPPRSRSKWVDELVGNRDLPRTPGEIIRPRGSTVPASASEISAHSHRLRVQPPDLLAFPTVPVATPPLSAPERRVEGARALDTPATAREYGRSGDERVNGVLGGRQTIADRRARAGSLGLPSPDYRIAEALQRDFAAELLPPRPLMSARTASNPMLRRKQSHSQPGYSPSVRHRHIPPPLHLEDVRAATAGDIGAEGRQLRSPDPTPSPMPQIIPLPPVSLHTYLQLELSSQHPSPLYIHRSAHNDFPYESSAVKFQRICNFLLLPPQIERVLLFGAAACFDAWLYNMTILPLRFMKAIWILMQSLGDVFATHVREIVWYVYTGWRRTWRRYGDPNGAGLTSPFSLPPSAAEDLKQSFQADGRAPWTRSPLPNPAIGSRVGFISPAAVPTSSTAPRLRRSSTATSRRHRRTQSQPSNLLPANKADILKGFLVLLSCLVLQKLDASQMYHDIKGQSAIKLYVIYSVLDVSDRLLSALGQDVLECLFSRETLERKSDGRSKVLRPLGMFVLALAYNVIHSSALFYQVITLNVAVNSYSNALLTLLLSSQFVEIKGTVFKKFEKENLFQLTCADVVERFQLGLLLTIIALRNIVEMGFGIIGGPASPFASSITSTSSSPSSSAAATYSMLPKSFTIFPAWTGRVTGPFLLVLGSEMLVDWLKHAYIGKFNNTKPAIYGRYLDVLAKDYYTNAFADQNLTKRLGLPVIPLSCLAIRAGVQMWHTFLATNERVQGSRTSYVFPDPASMGTASTTAASLKKFDSLWSQMLHPSSAFLQTSSSPSSAAPSTLSSLLDWLIGAMPTLTFVLTTYLLALTLKLVLGMALLHISRNRYHTMKQREHEPVEMAGKRVGGWGVVEVDSDKRRTIFEGDVRGMREARERGKEKERRGGVGGEVDPEPEGDAVGGLTGDRPVRGGAGGKRKELQRDGGWARPWGVEELTGISRWNMSGKRIW